MRFAVGVTTDIGRVRDGNEDAFLVDPPLYAVADGMGGHRGGEVASQLALETLEDRFRASDGTLADQVRQANRAVFERSVADRKVTGMGTTLTAALIRGEVAHLVHVGDSRGYLLRAGAFRQLTEDHTLVTRMVRAGEITEAEAQVHPHRNVLTRVLGTEADVDLDEQDVGLLEGDRLLLCSDGLTTMLTVDQVQAILETTPDPQEASDRLVVAANRAGGVDNITVLIVDVLEGEDADVEDTAGAVRDAVGDGTRGPAAPLPVSGSPRTRRWVRGVVAAVALVVVVIAGYAGLRAWLDTRWYLGVANAHVAIYQGVPAEIVGIQLSQLDTETNLSAAEVQKLPFYTDLANGINVDSREDALARIDQMRKDLRAQRRAAKGLTG